MVQMQNAKSPQHKFSWTSVHEVVPAEYFPAAILAPGWQALETRLGIKFGDHVDPDLGRAKAVYFKIGERDFVIESLTDAPTDFEYIRILVSSSYLDSALTELIEDILAATGIESTELSWKNEAIQFKPHEVWRQDDNGNKFLVERKPCKADAEKLCAVMTARGHKQMYWVQTI